MAEWKELVFTDNVANLGNTDLESTASTRKFNLKQAASGVATRQLEVNALSNAGLEHTGMELKATYNSNPAVAPSMTMAFSGSSLSFDADTTSGTGIMSFNSSLVWQCVAPIPYFQCDSFRIQNRDTGSASNPVLTLERRPAGGSSSENVGEDNDLLGVIEFIGEDSGGSPTTFAKIQSSISDASNATEDGVLDMKLINDGNLVSALKILPDTAEPLKALEVYDEDLWTLVQNATKYNCKKHLKMFACNTDDYGLPVNAAMLFRFNPPQASTPDNNEAYELNSTLTANFLGGSYNIDGAQGDFLFDQDADENDGIGDGWFSHERAADSPSVQIRVHGSVWYKPKVDPTDAQKVRFFYGYNQQAGGTVTDISESSGMEFAFGGYASDDITLSDGEEVTKMEFEFKKTLPAISVRKTELFIVGIKNTSSTTTSIGQNSSNSVNDNTGGFVADLEMEVLAISA